MTGYPCVWNRLDRPNRGKIREPGLENAVKSPYIIARVAPAGSLWIPAKKVSDKRTMSDKRTDNEQMDSFDLAVEEARPKLKEPPLYRVVLINDDYTPMEFVVDILESIFGMERTRATQVMLEVHTKGKGVCGVFSFEIAETKVAQVNEYSRQNKHPLLCAMEEA